MNDLPDDIQRMLRREGDEIEFTPPSFERWMGHLHMLRTLSSMAGFLLIWLVTYSNGMGWETATVRGIIAAVMFHFFSWAAGLFIFGEMYTAEVKKARRDLEERERQRAEKIERYYRERMQAQGMIPKDSEPAESVSAEPIPQSSPVTQIQTSPMAQPDIRQRAA